MKGWHISFCFRAISNSWSWAYQLNTRQKQSSSKCQTAYTCYRVLSLCTVIFLLYLHVDQHGILCQTASVCSRWQPKACLCPESIRHINFGVYYNRQVSSFYFLPQILVDFPQYNRGVTIGPVQGHVRRVRARARQRQVAQICTKWSRGVQAGATFQSLHGAWEAVRGTASVSCHRVHVALWWLVRWRRLVIAVCEREKWEQGEKRND
jgi:hypothetical protein